MFAKGFSILMDLLLILQLVSLGGVSCFPNSPPPSTKWKKTQSILSPNHLQNSCFPPLSHPISSSVIITSCNIIPTQLNRLTLEHEKKNTVFVFPLDFRCTGAWISWLETDQCVSNALRWKHFEALWSFGKHTHAQTQSRTLNVYFYRKKY